MEITRGKIVKPKKVVIYGPEGIGKSTFASCFPNPVFIDTEGSTTAMDVARLPKPTSWAFLMEEVRYIIRNPNECRTLVIDTADWAEQLCVADICGKYQKSGIEDFGYGKGYIFLQEEFGRLLNLLEDVISQGVHVVVTAHAKMRKFEQPDEMGAYDRWEMKLSKNVAPLVKEWADMILFANYETRVVKVDGKNKAQGGRRVVYTTHHSCWDAKNRFGLSDKLPFEYASIADVIKEAAPTPPVSIQSEPQMKPDELPDQSIDTAETPSGEQMEIPLETPEVLNLDPRIPKKLRDLMEQYKVGEWDLQNVVEAKGYVPMDTPIWDYDTVNPGIVDGLLVASWDQVYSAIKEMRENAAIPFN